MHDENTIKHLNYLLKTYDTVTQSVAKTAQRLCSAFPEENAKGSKEWASFLKMQPEYDGMVKVKGNIERRIRKELSQWPVWSEWLELIPGIGPFIAGNLIMMYYYKFIPVCACGGDLEKRVVDDKNLFVCKACEKQAKGDGVLNHRIGFRDFGNVSSLWHFMGRHVVNGNMPKRAKGVTCDWSTKGRTLTFQVGDQFNRQKEDHPYKAYLLKMKKKHERKNADREKEWTKGHIQNAARNEAAKLFLSHFWHVARTIDNKPTAGPYAEVILKHTGIIAPYFWEEVKKAA